MGRVPRIQIEQGLYLIMTRGDHGNNLFKEDSDRQQYLELLLRYQQQYAFKLFSYVLFPAYLYLLLEVAIETTISQVMHAINSSYTKYFNNKYSKKGHLFQERFRATLVEKDTYLLEITRYLHRIPYISGLTDDPQPYQWSSYGHYLNDEIDDVLGIRANAIELLTHFSHDTNEQRTLYKKFVESANKEDLNSFTKRLKKSYILGSKEFVEAVKEKSEQVALEKQKQQAAEGVVGRSNKTFLIVGSISVIILFVFTVYSYMKSVGLRGQYNDMIEQQSIEFSQQLGKEVERLKKNLEGKHSADKISYRAMQKRLEFEKKKTQDLEDKLIESHAEKESGD